MRRCCFMLRGKSSPLFTPDHGARGKRWPVQRHNSTIRNVQRFADRSDVPEPAPPRLPDRHEGQWVVLALDLVRPAH